MNWQDIPMPPLVAARPKNKHGFPSLYTSAILPGGEYDLRLNDPEKVLECFHKRLCSVCGNRIQDVCIFIGGPLSVANRCFSDPPCHYSCAKYAMQVCPYLHSTRDHHLQEGDRPHEGMVVTNMAQGVGEKPEFMALYSTRDYIGCADENGRGWVFYAGLPHLVEWWHMASHTRKAPSPLPIPRRMWPPKDLWLYPLWRKTR